MTVKVERLVNLTVALLETRKPLTFAEIRQRTRFYDQSDAESARRMFERDKDDLRSLGVPVAVEEDIGGEPGYRVHRRDYELADVDLTSEEVAALALAVQLAGGAGSHLALAKLAARAPDPADLDAQVTTRVTVHPDPVDDVAEAVVTRRSLRFRYRTAGGDVRQRTVDPYAVVQRRGAWYLVGRDHDRDDLRTFRLDRVVGRARLVGSPGSYEVPDDLDPAARVAGPDAERLDVDLAVHPRARWAVELRGGTDTGRTHRDLPVLRVAGLDPVRDRSWLLGLGPDVEVLRPAELRQQVADGLRRLVADGAGATGGAAGATEPGTAP